MRTLWRFISAPVRHWRVSLTVVIALLILFTITDQVLLSKLAAKREAILAAGGHLSLRDFAMDIPEGENAAVVYEYAASVVVEPEPPTGSDLKDPLQYVYSGGAAHYGCGGACRVIDRPLTPEEEAWVGKYLAANEQVFKALREAAAKPACQYGDYDLSDEALANPAVVMPKLNHLVELARLAAVRAVWEGRHGNVAGAYQWVGTALEIGNSVSNDPLLTGGLKAAVCHQRALDALSALLRHSAVPDPLPQEFAHELAAAADQGRLKTFYEGERTFGNAMDVTMAGHFLRPLLTSNQIAALETTTDLIEAVSEQDPARRLKRMEAFKAETASLAVKSGPLSTVRNAHRVLADILRPALERSVDSLETGVACARVAQAAVALKQYKQARGAYPAEVEALVPGYLEGVPVDPFSAEPLRYERRDEGFVVYSVGRDGRDDGGALDSQNRADLVFAVDD